MTPHSPQPLSDPFHLSRFVVAQEETYDQALRELRQGRKESHWMWFIFPQLAGLGSSSTARHYAIKNFSGCLDERTLGLLAPVAGSGSRTP